MQPTLHGAGHLQCPRGTSNASKPWDTFPWDLLPLHPSQEAEKSLTTGVKGHAANGLLVSREMGHDAITVRVLTHQDLGNRAQPGISREKHSRGKFPISWPRDWFVRWHIHSVATWQRTPTILGNSLRHRDMRAALKPTKDYPLHAWISYSFILFKLGKIEKYSCFPPWIIVGCTGAHCTVLCRKLSLRFPITKSLPRKKREYLTLP